MATKKATLGIFNARGVKAPRPNPSSKGFKWPERRGVTTDHRRAFAVFMRKRMEETNQTHITLAKTWWGVTEVGGTNGALIAKWLRMEQMPSRILAERVAEFFNVSLEEMLEDKDPYSDPSHLIVSKNGQPLGAPAKPARAAAKAIPTEQIVAPPVKKTYKKKTATNGNDAQVLDPRWKLPAGVPAPRIMIDLAPDSPGRMTKVQIEAYVPPEVAMALYTTLVEHRPPSPAEVAAPVQTPTLVGHTPGAGG